MVRMRTDYQCARAVLAAEKRPRGISKRNREASKKEAADASLLQSRIAWVDSWGGQPFNSKPLSRHKWWMYESAHHNKLMKDANKRGITLAT